MKHFPYWLRNEQWLKGYIIDPKESKIQVLLISYNFESAVYQCTGHKASSWFTPYLVSIFVGVMRAYLPQKSSTSIHSKIVKNYHCGWIWNTCELCGLYQKSKVSVVMHSLSFCGPLRCIFDFKDSLAQERGKENLYVPQ